MTAPLAHSTATSINQSATLLNRQRSYHNTDAPAEAFIVADVNSMGDGLPPLREQFAKLEENLREWLEDIKTSLNDLAKEEKKSFHFERLAHRVVRSLLEDLLAEVGKKSIIENKMLNHFYREKTHQHATDLIKYIDEKLLPLADELLSDEASQNREERYESELELRQMCRVALEGRPIIEKLWENNSKATDSKEHNNLKNSLSAFFALVGFKILRVSTISSIFNQASVLSETFQTYYSTALTRFQKAFQQATSHFSATPKGKELINMREIIS